MNDFIIRRAEITDAGIIAHHRARMFCDMGQMPDAIFDDFRARAERWLRNSFRNDEYLGWLTSQKSSPQEILAGAGVQLRRVAPHPLKKPNGEVAVAEGRHAILINVFTEPEWRRRGLAEALLREIIDWAREERLDRVLLHASKDGRKLYERLGFVLTNEMRYEGNLAGNSDGFSSA